MSSNRWLFCPLVVLGLLLAACGGSDDDAAPADDATPEATGDAAAACAFLEEQAESDIDLDDEEGLAMLRDLAELVPGDLRNHLLYMVETVEELTAMDEDDPEAFGAAFGLMFDPRFLMAAERLEAFAVEECGFDPDFFDEGEDAMVVGEFDGFDPDVDIDVDGAREFLENEHADATWSGEITAWSWSGNDVSAVAARELSSEEALELCEAIETYLFEVAGLEAARIMVSDDSEEEYRSVSVDGPGDCTAA